MSLQTNIEDGVAALLAASAGVSYEVDTRIRPGVDRFEGLVLVGLRIDSTGQNYSGRAVIAGTLTFFVSGPVATGTTTKATMDGIREAVASVDSLELYEDSTPLGENWNYTLRSTQTTRGPTQIRGDDGTEVAIDTLEIRVEYAARLSH